MGVADRDYLKAGAFRERGWTGSPVTWALILSNSALWLVSAGSGGGLYEGTLFHVFDALALHPADVLDRGRLWQPLTTLFVHDPRGVGPVLWNMAYLFLFGREMETILGRLAYLRLYVLSGLAASLIAVGASALWDVHGAVLMGASGCVFGVLTAFACRRPHEPVFASIPAWAFVGALVAAQCSWFGAAGRSPLFFAHLAGVLVGLGEGWLLPRRAAARTKRADARLRSREEERARSETDERRRVDALLEKINRSGISSLSDEERQFLHSASKRFR